MQPAMTWLADHPLVAWLVASSAANILVDVIGASDTAVGRVCRAVGLDIRRVIAPKAPK